MLSGLLSQASQGTRQEQLMSTNPSEASTQVLLQIRGNICATIQLREGMARGSVGRRLKLPLLRYPVAEATCRFEAPLVISDRPVLCIQIALSRRI
jgi:hypothetical protein